MPSGSPTLSGGSTRRLTGSGHTSTQRKFRYTVPFPTSPTSSLSSSPSSLSSSPGSFFPRDFGSLKFNPATSNSRRRKNEVGPEDVTFKVLSCEKGRMHAVQFYEKKPGMKAGGGLVLGFCEYHVPEDVDFTIVEKKVYFDEDSGEWVLELVSEVERGRRMRRCTY